MLALHPYGYSPGQNPLHVESHSFPEYPWSHSQYQSESPLGVHFPFPLHVIPSHGFKSQRGPLYESSQMHALRDTGSVPPRYVAEQVPVEAQRADAQRDSVHVGPVNPALQTHVFGSSHEQYALDGQGSVQRLGHDVASNVGYSDGLEII